MANDLAGDAGVWMGAPRPKVTTSAILTDGHLIAHLHHSGAGCPNAYGYGQSSPESGLAQRLDCLGTGQLLVPRFRDARRHKSDNSYRSTINQGPPRLASDGNCGTFPPLFPKRKPHFQTDTIISQPAEKS